MLIMFISFQLKLLYPQGSHLEMGEVKLELSSTEGNKTESQIASISDADIFSASSGRDNAKKGSPVTTKATASYDSNIEMGEVKKEFSFTKGNKTESDSLQTIESTAGFSFADFSRHPRLVDIV